MDINKVIKEIESVKKPTGKIPQWIKLICTKEDIASMTFEATKKEIMDKIKSMGEK